MENNYMVREKGKSGRGKIHQEAIRVVQRCWQLRAKLDRSDQLGISQGWRQRVRVRKGNEESSIISRLFLFEPLCSWWHHFDMRKTEGENKKTSFLRRNQKLNNKKRVPPSLSCGRLLLTFGPHMSAQMSPPQGLAQDPTLPLHPSLILPCRVVPCTYHEQLSDH